MAKREDRLHTLSKNPDGTQNVVRVINAENNEGQEFTGVSVGQVIPMKEGQAAPPGSEVIAMTGEEDCWRDVEHIHGNMPKPPSTSASGPAQVNSRAYHVGWDAIFGKKTKTNSSVAN